MSQVDRHGNDIRLVGPSTDSVPVDVSSTDVVLDPPARALWIGGQGNIKVDTLNGTARTFLNIPSGYELEGWVTKVYSSGTSCTGIMARY